MIHSEWVEFRGSKRKAHNWQHVGEFQPSPDQRVGNLYKIADRQYRAVLPKDCGYAGEYIAEIPEVLTPEVISHMHTTAYSARQVVKRYTFKVA